MEHMEHPESASNERSTQTIEQVAAPETEAPGKTETQLIRAAVARVIAQSDCECTLQGSTTWNPVSGFVTTYSYVDQYGRDWGYDSTCGGRVKPKTSNKPAQ